MLRRAPAVAGARLGAPDRVGYPVRVPSLFRRKSTDLAEDAIGSIDDESADLDGGEAAGRRSYTPGKGRATPKRREAQSRRVEPPPANRREAVRRQRLKVRQERQEARAGMMAGDQRRLLPRDRGPERALIRDIVDSRRNVGTWFFGAAFIVVLGSFGIVSTQFQVALNLFWALAMVALVIDFILLGRRVNRILRARFPDTTRKMAGHYLYACLRSLSFRRIRIPAPQVKLGQKI
jgi:DUF3043 family protein